MAVVVAIFSDCSSESTFSCFLRVFRGLGEVLTVSFISECMPVRWCLILRDGFVRNGCKLAEMSGDGEGGLVVCVMLSQCRFDQVHSLSLANSSLDVYYPISILDDVYICNK